MKFLPDDSLLKEKLYPFTYTRQAADIRVGILTIREKWEKLEAMGYKHSTIPGNILPSKGLQDALFDGSFAFTEIITEGNLLEQPQNIFQLNDEALRQDFELLTRGRISAPLSNTNQVIAPENIFIEPGATAEHCILNASTGPIYIGKNAQLMEGSMVRGPFAICEGSILKMGSKIYGATTVGPYSVAAGEIKNSVIFGYSNKAHDGYLGDSVIGSWCNLGAGTTNSNLKNTAGEVKLWNRSANGFVTVGLKCGLLMGDYTRTAINTNFNTGTVAGVCCNIFGDNFPPKYIPDFSWGKERYLIEKALQDLGNWKKFKNKSLTEEERLLLTELYTSPSPQTFSGKIKN